MTEEIFVTWQSIVWKSLPEIITLSSGVVGVLLALLSWQQRAMRREIASNLAISVATHDSTNSKMDRLLAIVEKSAEAEGALRGRREMTQELLEASKLKEAALKAAEKI